MFNPNPETQSLLAAVNGAPETRLRRAIREARREAVNNPWLFTVTGATSLFFGVVLAVETLPPPSDSNIDYSHPPNVIGGTEPLPYQPMAYGAIGSVASAGAMALLFGGFVVKKYFFPDNSPAPEAQPQSHA